MSSEPLDALIRTSGRKISVLRTPGDIADFAERRATAKLLLFYWDGCYWCRVFVPDFINVAPLVPNSDLVVGAVERSNMAPALNAFGLMPDFGFPHTVLFDANKTVRQVFRGSRPCKTMVGEIFQAMPELLGRPSLAYLEPMRSGGSALLAPTPSPTPAAPLPAAAGTAEKGMGRAANAAGGAPERGKLPQRIPASIPPSIAADAAPRAPGLLPPRLAGGRASGAPCIGFNPRIPTRPARPVPPARPPPLRVSPSTTAGGNRRAAAGTSEDVGGWLSSCTIL